MRQVRLYGLGWGPISDEAFHMIPPELRERAPRSEMFQADDPKETGAIFIGIFDPSRGDAVTTPDVLARLLSTDAWVGQLERLGDGFRYVVRARLHPNGERLSDVREGSEYWPRTIN